MNNSKIVYINQDEKFLLYDKKELQTLSKSVSKKYYTALLVPPSALYMYSQKLPSTLDDEQISIKMDIGMYNDGGADERDEYTTGFIRHDLPTDDDNLVDLFGLTDKQANALYGKIAQETKAIDLIAPMTLIYESLYTHEETRAYTDIYLYLSDEESFAVIYYDGKYIAHRSMESLARMSAQAAMDLPTLKALLKTKGVDESAYSEDEFLTHNLLQNSFAKSIERIMHTINHKQGIFGFERVDRVYIDFEGDVVVGLENVFQAYDIDVKKINPVKANIQVATDPKKQHDIIAANYIYGVAHNVYDKINLSPFKRDLPLFQKPAGHFLVVLAASVLLCFGLYYVAQIFIDSKNEEIASTQNEMNRVLSTTKQAGDKIKKLKAEYDSLQKEYSSLRNKSSLLNKAQQAVPIIQSAALQRQELMNDALKGLAENDLALKALDQNSSEKLTLNIVTTPDKQQNIANFMNYMTKRGYQRSFTNKIQRNDSLYQSIVEVIR